MLPLPSPHGDKLRALLQNPKLPTEDKIQVEQTLEKYEGWLTQLNELHKIQMTPDELTIRMVSALNNYRLFVDVNLIFDSRSDFLYRQKGQLKLDNTVIEEFLPLLVKYVLFNEVEREDLSFGPTNCFSGLWFESNLISRQTGGGIQIRSKAQDFAISRRLFIQASHHADFSESIVKETYIPYVAAECKTNLDKTM